MSQSSTSSSDRAKLVRRALYVLVALSLALANLFPLFRGLGTQQAMDHAQIGREVSRGNGLVSKFIRPAEYALAEEAGADGEGVPLTRDFKQTMHAPLYPLMLGAVFKVIGAGEAGAYQMGGARGMIFPLDRVVAGVSTLCFLLSIGVGYLLMRRVFDEKIAAVTAILLLFSELLWGFASSGLPQMAVMLYFSCGLYFAYRAVEEQGEDRSPVVPALIGGVFFCLMALSHWVAVWVVIGYMIYAAVAFRPRGMVAIGLGGLLLVAVAWPVIEAVRQTGSPFGSAALVLQEALGSHPPDKIMRAAGGEVFPLDMQGIVLRIARMMVVQLTDLLPFLGGIIAAPLFFVALLHPFRRASIASFRWLVLLMWGMATLGMAMAGVSADHLHPNQLHLLFAPVMTGYGLALLSVMWSRLAMTGRGGFLGNGHLVAVIVISALPLLLAMPKRVRIGMSVAERGIPQWPPYVPSLLNVYLQNWVGEDEIVVSDQPWAVAWYADRTSVWLPLKRESFDRLEGAAREQGTPLVGILITPASHGVVTLQQVPLIFEEFSALVMDGPMVRATTPREISLYETTPEMQGLRQRYPLRVPMLGQEMIYYTSKPPPGG